MKKFVSVLLASLMAASIFAGCSGKEDAEPTAAPASTGEAAADSAFEEIKADLQSLNDDFFTSGDPYPEDMFVYGKDGIEGIDAMEDFYKKASKGEQAKIKMASATTDGDAVFTEVVYDGESYHCVIDRTRDKYNVEYNNPDMMSEMTFKYMKRFDYEVPNRGEHTAYIMLNDEKIYKDDDIDYYEYTDDVENEEGTDWVQLCSY